MNCSGCSACAAVCPRECIQMKLNSEGFLYPETDREKCINCSLCKKVCPYETSEKVSLDDGVLYSAHSLCDDIRKTTSSGGIGFCLAKQYKERNFAVCGAYYDYKQNCVRHAVSEDIERFKGSKYLQSMSAEGFRDFYNEIKKNDRKGIVFGTPCQIAGLDNVLKSVGIREQVLLVDIYCHGVPSYLLWRNYLKWLDDKKGISKEQIENISFRDKKFSWHSYYMHIKTKEKEYICDREADPFLKIFTMGIVNRRECITCQFRNASCADIRLGDFWGKRYKDSEEGFSMVIALTDRGREAISSLKEIELFECDIKERFGQQHMDYPFPEYYLQTIEMLKNKTSLKKIISLYEPVTVRIKRKVRKSLNKIAGSVRF